MAKVAGAPSQEVMGMINKHFDSHDSLIVKQTMRGCCQECMGCEAKSEFKVAPLKWSDVDTYQVSDAAMNVPDSMYALENSSCCMRLCWRDGRPFNMKVSEGADAGGAGIINFRKPCGFPLHFKVPTKDGSMDCPCCCLLPKVINEDPNGNTLGGESKYICDQNCYVPKLKYVESGQPIYVVKPETCCGGCCIKCGCGGKGCVYIPFYFHDPATNAVIGGSGYSGDAPQIRKVWAGLKKECCSTADTFVVKFPKDITADRKAGLLGMTFLLDFTVFENQQDGQ